MILPKFVIAGGMPAGTSFLSTALKNHPEIYLPKVQRPEPNFFHYTWKYRKGIEWYSKTLFSDVSNEKAIGERSSLLLTSKAAIQRMKKHIPDAKLIFCLRNPIERAWASYRYTVLEGLEQLSFSEAIEQEEDRRQNAVGKWKEVLPYAYVERSHYADQLTKFINVFGREKLFLICSEEFGKKPQETLSNICQFIGVNPDFEFELPANFSSPTVINPALQKELNSYFGDRFADISECIRKEKNLDQLIRNTQDKINVLRLRKNLKTGKDPLNESDRKKLRSLLGREIQRVGEIVDFSIDHWI
jgi:hypothetical protein